MKRIVLSLNKPYAEQSQSAQQRLNEYDFNAILSLIAWRNKYKNELKKER